MNEKTTFRKSMKNRKQKLFHGKTRTLCSFTVLTETSVKPNAFRGLLQRQSLLLITLNVNIVLALPGPLATVMFDHFSSLLILIRPVNFVSFMPRYVQVFIFTFVRYLTAFSFDIWFW